MLLVMIPTTFEYIAIKKNLEERGFSETLYPVGKITAAYYPDIQMIFVPSGLGKAQAAVQTQYALDRLEDVSAVILAGAAGGVAPELIVGDVVLAESTLEHDFIQRFIPTPHPQFAGDSALLERFTPAATTDLSFAVYRGLSASGDEDIVDRAKALAIRERFGAMTVSWEGAGVARVCHFNEVPFLEIRGISDNADHEAAENFSMNLHGVMGNILHVLTLGVEALSQ